MFVFAFVSLEGAAQAAPDNLDQVVRALSLRDGVTCDQVEALTSTPFETLQHVVNTVEMPPWAPMTAAGCLIQRHPVEAKADLETWVTNPELKGLGKLVVLSMDLLLTEVAVPVAQKAIHGNNAELAAQKFAVSSSADVRAVVAQ